MTASNERKVSRTTTARAPEEVVEPKKSTKFTTTLAAYGDRLPIGVLDTEGRLHKDIVCKTWKTRDERELGKKLANETSMADHVPIVIANMCSRIGPHDFEKIDDVEKSVVIATMYMADVFYVYALLRAKTMGNRLALNIDCPRQGCGVRFPFVGDLASLDVVGVEDIDDILWRYDLETPIDIRQRRVTHFQLAYPKWSVMQASKAAASEADIKAYAIQGAIVGINDEQTPLALSLAELDELSKPDFEGLQESINQNFFGPKMGVEGRCTPEVCARYKRGDYEFKASIDWSYRYFFGASSR